MRRAKEKFLNQLAGVFLSMVHAWHGYAIGVACGRTKV